MAKSSVSIFAAISVVLLLLVYTSGSMHDYIAYSRQWQSILTGADPWDATYDAVGRIPENAYGPVHALLAELAPLHPLLPKFAMAALTLGVVWIPFGLNATTRDRRQAASKLLWLYVLSPVVVVTVFVFGINDALVGVLFLVTCLLRVRRAYGWTGVMLGLAALLKFYPILFTPFFAVSRSGTVKLRTMFAAAATFASGMGLAWLKWGDSIFTPFLFGDERGPKQLSILKFLNTFEDKLSIEIYVDYLLSVNSLAVVSAAAVVSVWGWLTRQGWEITGLFGILVIFMTYKVGHVQFYVSWIALYSWILAVSRDERAVSVARAFAPLAAFLALYQISYIVSYLQTGAYFLGPFVWFRVYGSVVLWVVTLWCLRRASSHLGRTVGPRVSISI
ncbi:Protein of unknown function [Aliiroseovarius halocynthiae]|uniref:DUF2029 domain-containing protein n=1 Tax=Aliiroseovarius halocynthiae TaxID=985055 RepID=A0A545SNH7_9RHOB|nr:glycosyltransferase family 87 protein [Aliiroseovarius halocynthiae]TQV66538.1 DUF2029 domain-containing protein [Aliiroseovarius halocynthiae]SMR82594.1 Protein of unknown function [Aliiroseovarius halocynthiae]